MISRGESLLLIFGGNQVMEISKFGFGAKRQRGKILDFLESEGFHKFTKEYLTMKSLTVSLYLSSSTNM